MSSYTERLSQQNAESDKKREELVRDFQGQVKEFNTQYSEKAGDIVKTIEEHRATSKNSLV